MSPKLRKSTATLLVSFNWKHQENTLFYFNCYSEGNASIKKVNIATLPWPYTKRTHQLVHSEICHMGVPAGQTRSVKSGI